MGRQDQADAESKDQESNCGHHRLLLPRLQL
jgi:hypothetical protein